MYVYICIYVGPYTVVYKGPCVGNIWAFIRLVYGPIFSPIFCEGVEEGRSSLFRGGRFRGISSYPPPSPPPCNPPTPPSPHPPIPPIPHSPIPLSPFPPSRGECFSENIRISSVQGGDWWTARFSKARLQPIFRTPSLSAWTAALQHRNIASFQHICNNAALQSYRAVFLYHLGPAPGRPESSRNPAGFRLEPSRIPARIWLESGRNLAGFRLESG